ncbi:MAG: hypothetical protein ABSG83_11935, partial [Roseiarcus sp.]
MLDMRVMAPRFPQTDREVKRHPTHLSPVSLTAPSPFGRNLVDRKNPWLNLLGAAGREIDLGA